MSSSSPVLKHLALPGVLAFCLMASMPTQGSISIIRQASPPLITMPPSPSSTPAPVGLVGWWKGDGNALDNVGANSGVNQNITYSSGMVGQGFACDPENYAYGTYTGIQIADQPAYALTNALTIEGWIRPRGDGYIIFFRGDHRPGLDPYFLAMQGNHTLLFNICDANGNSANVATPVDYFAWTHVAATLDGSSGTLSLYTNGVLAAQTNTIIRPFAALLPGQSPGIGIGNLNDGGNNFPFLGDIDEIGLYNRALTIGEIQSIYNAGSAGKCAPVPSVVPAIFGVTPMTGPSGTTVTISGTNFSSAAAADIVFFGAVRATVLSASLTNLQVSIPTGATFAPITVAVNGLMAYAPQPFLPTFIGSGANNSLSPRLDLPAPDGSGLVNFADMDGDGKSDLVVCCGNGVILIYRNISTGGTVTTGSFAPRVDLTVPTGLDTLTIADVDGDGKLDTVLLNRDLNQVMVLQNLSAPGILTTNSFAAPVFFSTGSDPRGLSVRDLDGDGKPELIVGNWGDNTVSVFHNTGAPGITTNSFSPAVNFAVGTSPQGLAVADLDGDGQPDIATANNNYVTDNSVSILRNTGSLGNISFATHVDLAGLATSYGIVIGDLDGDGKLDIAVSSFDYGQAVSVYRNTSTPGSITTGSFAPHVDFAAGGWGNALTIGDLDGDGKPDLAVVTQLPDHLSIFKNISTPGSFTSSSLAPRVDYSAGWNPNGVAIGDLDGDGRPDIAFAVSYAATLSIYQNQTPLNLPPPPLNLPAIASFGPASGSAGTSVTISGANFSASATSNIVYFGAVRAIVSSASTTNLTVSVAAGATFAPITVTTRGLTTYSPQPFLPTFVGTGEPISTASFGPRQDLASGNGPNQVVIADLDNDGKPDLIVANDYNNTISLYRNISADHTLTAASFAPPVDLATPTGSYSPYGIVAADVDGDGKLDIVASNFGDNNVSVYRNSCSPGDISSNAFAMRVDFPTGAQPQGVAVGDIDGDGRTDLLVANTGTGTISILRNTSVVGSLTAGSFAPKIDITTGSGCDSVTVGDLDGDSLPDVVTADAGSDTVSLLRNFSSPGTIAFDAKADLATPGYPIHVKLVDLDGDGKLDLAVACNLPQRYSIYRNTSTVGSLTADSLAPRIDYPLGGRGHTTAVGDLDGDGKPDLAVATELDSMISIFQNTGTPGSFTNSSLTNPINFSTGWNAWGVAVGDLDGDGRPDVVFANSYDHNISIYQNLVPLAGPPTITAQPATQTAIEGATTTLSVMVNGVPPFGFQWNFNGAPIAGGTNATLVLANLHPNQTGNYTVTISSAYGDTTSSNILVTVTAQTILIYKYSGLEKITSAGQSVSNAYAGEFFFIPDTTNGTFVGWSNIKGRKFYWVNPLSGYLLFGIAGAGGQSFTVIGQAGQEMDTNSQPHLWADLHKGQNAKLTVGKKKYFTFPNTFADTATHLYPNPQTGSMILNEANSTYTFLLKDTQNANNNGLTVTDLVNALTRSLTNQGYQSQ